MACGRLQLSILSSVQAASSVQVAGRTEPGHRCCPGRLALACLAQLLQLAPPAAQPGEHAA